MIKSSVMFSAHTAHVFHVLLRNTLIFFIILFIALFFWIKIGIQADTLNFGKYKIEGLYLKLGKKLTLKADKVVVSNRKAQPSFENIDKTFDNIKYLFTFFDVIDLKNIHFENNKLGFKFKDNILGIDSDDYEISGDLHRKNDVLIANISQLFIKKTKVNVQGKLNYHFKNALFLAEGNFDAFDISGNFVAKIQDDNLAFKVNSTKFSNLTSLIDTFNVKGSLRSWILKRVEAKKYKLYSLEGKAVIKEGEVAVDFDTLKAKMLFEDVKIHYHKKLDPIFAKSFTLTYKEKALFFDLIEPTYKDIDLNGSKIAVVGLDSKKTLLKLDLKMRTHIDDDVQKILKAYDVDIPVKHKGQKSKLSLLMDIPLGKENKVKKSTIEVSVDVSDGLVWYDKVMLPIKQAKVTFDNRKEKRIYVEAMLKKGTVEIGKTKLHILGGKGTYRNNTVTLDNVHIKESWYEGKVRGDISLLNKKATLKLDAKEVAIGDNKKFFVLKNKMLPIRLNYAKQLRIDFPSLDIKVSNKKKEMHIDIGSLSKIKPYIRGIGIGFEEGNINIVKKDSKYTFTGILKRKSCFFYDNNNICHTKVPITGNIKAGGLNFYAFDKRIHYSSKKSRLNLNRINIDLEKFLNERETKKSNKNNKKLVILGKNSKIRFGKHVLLTDSYDIEVSKNTNVKAFGSLDGDIVKFSKVGKIFSINALRVTDKMLHPLIGFSGLKKGRYSLSKYGNPNKIMKGQIIVEGGVMNDFKAYNNTLALINAIPALATLSSPGFSEKGFTVEEGVVEYRMTKDKILFDSVYIKGTSATIVGKGEIDLKKKTLNLKLAIQTARELGKIVGNLPLIGYILMGRDKSMTVGLTITGSLDKPKVETSAAKDILSLPLHLIKRTLESPAHIFNK